MKNQRRKHRREKVIENILLAVACVGVVLALYFTGEPVKQPEASTAAETATEPYTVKSYFDVPLSPALQDHIFNLCAEYEIEPEIVIAIIKNESDFDSAAIGDSGNSLGLMQIFEKHHEDRIEKLGVTDLLDPAQNVAVGVDYLAELIKAYDGNIEKALVAYNAGRTGAYNNFFSKGIYKSKYSRKVLENAENIKEGVKEMYFTDDPLRDFENWDAEQQAKLDKLPVCADCGEHIQEDHFFLINDEPICPDCLDSNYRKPVEDYVG